MSALRRSCVVVAAALAVAWPASGADSIAVIVHPSLEASASEEDLARIFLRKRRFWSPGLAIVPVNRDATSEARARFTAVVFGNTARRLGTYWNQQYFLGVLPPATLASDEAVKRFVASEPGAIGYVRTDALDGSVRVLLLLE